MSSPEPVLAAARPDSLIPAVQQPKREDLLAGWLSSLESLLATVVIAVFVITFVVQAFQIPSESMENTLLIGDYLLVNKLCYGKGHLRSLVPYQPIKRGDIVVFHYPVNPAQHFVKRVIGVPGDHVRLIKRQVWVNGLPIKEDYVRFSRWDHDPFRDDFPKVNYLAAGEEAFWFQQLKRVVQNGELVIPDGQYFVMGDNRDQSDDSRYWGFVPRANIVGSPLLIYWSIRSPEQDSSTFSSRDKIFRFVYAVTHLFQITRWDRTFRLVN